MTAGWTAIPNWIARDPNISLTAKAVYMALSSRLGRDGVVIPKHATIASETGVSVSTVKRALRELRELGVLSWEPQRRDDGSQTSNSYSILAHPITPQVTSEQGTPPVHPRPTPQVTSDLPPRSPVTYQEEDSLEEDSLEEDVVGTTTHQSAEPSPPPGAGGGWTPSAAAMRTARDAVTEVDIPLHITRYRIVCHEKKRTPSNAEWLRWLIEDEKRAREDARKQEADERRKRRWDAVAD